MTSAERLLWIIPFCFLAFFAVDIYNYSMMQWKANHMTDYAVEQLAAAGGWTPEVDQKIKQELNRMNITADKWQVGYTDSSVRAPGEVYFRIHSTYRVSAFDVFGTQMKEMMGNRLVLNIDDSKTAVSQIY
ncbi:hypothetical protein [Aneurinibacillus thermoaerophilus]|uniref:hypothetical protein n=1 Tax=Aneurinibacillus thermoaerophilus TaxID=143495 RepID=UPI002E1F8677|nr:hypothetical protein [Aneurinibacillus thermoaerophilus]